MLNYMTGSKPAKGYYTEAEAAAALGLGIEAFRTLIRKHIVEGEDDMNNVPTTTFQASDVWALKLFLLGVKTETVKAPEPDTVSTDPAVA